MIICSCCDEDYDDLTGTIRSVVMITNVNLPFLPPSQVSSWLIFGGDICPQTRQQGDLSLDMNYFCMD